MSDARNEAPQPGSQEGPPSPAGRSPNPSLKDGWPPRLDPRKNSLRDAIFFGPHGMRAGWSAAVFLLFFVFFIVLAGAVESLFRHSLLTPGHPPVLSPAALFYQELLSGAAAIGATAVMGRLEDRSFGDYGLPLNRALHVRFWQGVLWGVLQVSALMLLIAGLHGYSFGALTVTGPPILRYGLQWAAAFLLVGFFEEFFFRGYLQTTLARGMDFWPSALLLSAGFGAVHLMNPGEGAAGAASVFVVGVFLCFTLWRTGSLWFAIGWHAAFDFAETYLYSVPDSGIVTTHPLSRSSLHGARWLTGGTVGPEGSVFAFVTMALAFLLFAALYGPRRERPLESLSEG